jgi:hypothetical protein
MMTEMIGQITKDELRRLINKVLEDKLVELFDDRDEELEISDVFNERLPQQKETTQPSD